MRPRPAWRRAKAMSKPDRAKAPDLRSKTRQARTLETSLGRIPQLADENLYTGRACRGAAPGNDCVTDACCGTRLSAKKNGAPRRARRPSLLRDRSLLHDRMLMPSTRT